MAAVNTDKEFFGDRADSFENFIPRIVPYYHEVNRLLLDLLPFPSKQVLKVLDIGAGTGVLSRLVLEHYANAQVVVTDASPQMVDTCVETLAPWQDRVRLRQMLFPEGDLDGPYDLVVSSLAIHHLEDADKALGFRRLFQVMNSGGVVMVRDYVAAPTPNLDRTYERLWRGFVDAHGQDDLSWFEAHRADDRPAPVDDQLTWLRDAGFADVACHWRYLSYALFGGRKP